MKYALGEARGLYATGSIFVRSTGLTRPIGLFLGLWKLRKAQAIFAISQGRLARQGEGESILYLTIWTHNVLSALHLLWIPGMKRWLLREYKRAQAIFEQYNVVSGLANTLRHMARIEMLTHLDQAHQYLKEALRLNQSLFIPTGEVDTYRDIARFEMRCQDYAQAEGWLIKALNTSVEYGDQLGRVKALLDLAYVHRKKSSLSKSIKLCNESLAILQGYSGTMSLRPFLTAQAYICKMECVISRILTYFRLLILDGQDSQKRG